MLAVRLRSASLASRPRRACRTAGRLRRLSPRPAAPRHSSLRASGRPSPSSAAVAVPPASSAPSLSTELASSDARGIQLSQQPQLQQLVDTLCAQPPWTVPCDNAQRRQSPAQPARSARSRIAASRRTRHADGDAPSATRVCPFGNDLHIGRSPVCSAVSRVRTQHPTSRADRRTVPADHPRSASLPCLLPVPPACGRSRLGVAVGLLPVGAPTWCGGWRWLSSRRP